MNMASYCKAEGMNINQYQQYQENIKAAAGAILSVIKAMYKTDTGVYHPTHEIISNVPGKNNEYTKAFIVQELKQIGVEFIENNTYWRY